MAQANKDRQKWKKQHKNTTLAGPSTQIPPWKKIEIVVTEN